jgi:hypothetical protein
MHHRLVFVVGVSLSPLLGKNRALFLMLNVVVKAGIVEEHLWNEMILIYFLFMSAHRCDILLVTVTGPLLARQT